MCRNGTKRSGFHLTACSFAGWFRCIIVFEQNCSVCKRFVVGDLEGGKAGGSYFMSSSLDYGLVSPLYTFYSLFRQDSQTFGFILFPSLFAQKMTCFVIFIPFVWHNPHSSSSPTFENLCSFVWSILKLNKSSDLCYTFAPRLNWCLYRLSVCVSFCFE